MHGRLESISCAGLFLEIAIEPFNGFSMRMQYRFSSSIAVTFFGQHHEPDGSTVPLDGLEHPLGLHGKGTGIVVGLAMDEQQRLIDLVGMQER